MAKAKKSAEGPSGRSNRRGLSRGRPGRGRGPIKILKVHTGTLKRKQVDALLDEFDPGDDVFVAQWVAGSPFLSLTLTPTKSASD